MEPFGTVEQISGADVIDDLCTQVAEKLSRSCDLRATDAYSSYSATVKIELQLTDVDTVAVSEQLAVGKISPAQPFEHIAVDVPSVPAEEIRERSGLEPSSLERTVDGSLPETAPKRQYVSRVRASR